ncbi:MAG: hypothetical protein FJW79_04550 [Actinobacteria bacterium]|nr:hypothetical protein [Actinomycetota bacterium]
MRRASALLLGLVLGLVPAAGATGDDARAAGKHLWTRQFGTSSADEGRAVAVNASGVYVLGHTGGTLPGQTSQGSSDVFLRKYDHSGKMLWTRQFGTSGQDQGWGIALHKSGVYAAGYTEGAFPGGTHVGSWDVFLRKYDHAGQHLWTRQFGTSGDDSGVAVAANASGVYIAGTTSGTLPGQKAQGDYDAFVRSYDHSGQHRWTRQFGTGEWDEGWGVAADASSVYIVGHTDGAFPGWANLGGSDVFVRSYDSSGTHRWTRQFGTAAGDSGAAVAVNDSGVYVLGSTSGVLPGQSIPSVSPDVFVRGYSHAGKHRWTRQFGTGFADAPGGVAVNATGVYVTGDTQGTLPGQTSLGNNDGFVRGYDHAGKYLWARQFGTAAHDYGYGIAATAAALYVTGETWGAFPGYANPGTSSDAFVRKYATG